MIDRDSPQLDDEAQAHQAPAQPLHQRRHRRGRAARGQHVVEYQHPGAGRDGVLVHFQPVRAVLQRVFYALGRGRQLARLAHRHEARAQRIGDGRREDEPARLDAHDDVHRRGRVMRL